MNKELALNTLKLHNLTPHGLMVQLFQTMNDTELFELTDTNNTTWYYKAVGHCNLYLIAKTNDMKEFIEIYFESDH
jgi:hypothetical protein